MWDRLLTDCHVATMEPAPGNPLGIIENGAIGIQDGRIVRVGTRTDLAGNRAREVLPLGGAWVTPGLIDCHTHLIFGGNRADEHAMRRAGASYQEIAEAGGGIASTVKRTREASEPELLASAAMRLDALMKGGVTTIEIKSGYGLDLEGELRLLRCAKALAASEAVRIVPTLLALHALPAEWKDRRIGYVSMVIDELLPAVADEQLAETVDAFCEDMAFSSDEVERLFKAAHARGFRVKLHAEQLSNQNGAALASKYNALSADHLEHLDEHGAAAMAEAGTVAVLLPGAFYALQEERKPPVQLLRDHKVPIAVATDCNPGTSPLLSPTLAMNMACTLFGLTPEEALAGMTINGAKALGIEEEIGTVAVGKAADLCVWRLESLAELGYWIGLPGPERRIYAGDDT
ncbi:imidazolonepropionase [Sphingomonas sp. RG327]|uniref:Imidazolonepropionase n=1 Tax=Sphingomonas anseongensis TaxID=2908207 RepID=A0ABT0RG35_9SPHN|nr:imidazolonepropionase [Sphingomonas anseongensis]MCL6679198.1 imidazolonepropionase [Sphingomonas anseongensis]